MLMKLCFSSDDEYLLLKITKVKMIVWESLVLLEMNYGNTS